MTVHEATADINRGPAQPLDRAWRLVARKELARALSRSH